MPERPIILFPQMEVADRDKRKLFVQPPRMPNFARQYSRLAPKFAELQVAIERKNIVFQNTPAGVEPEMALVFETVGSVENFYSAVKKVAGLEWMFDIAIDDILPDDDFYSFNKDGIAEESLLSGKIYCVMSNKTAIEELVSLWDRYNRGEEEAFKRGFAGLRDIFVHIKDIRFWGPQDRISETKAFEYWKEQLAYDGAEPVPFEVELFFRHTQDRRSSAKQLIDIAVQELNGHVISECTIEDISYHGLLVEMPRDAIQKLVDNYDDVKLVHVDDIMFFRPTCQSAYVNTTDSMTLETCEGVEVPNHAEPIIALLDGMPLQNHPILAGRLIVDDPDGYEVNYESKYRFHGTAMASLILCGDLEREKIPLNRPIYIRPVLKPELNFAEGAKEMAPQDKLFIDLIHRSIVRLVGTDGGDEPKAPSVKIINLSIGDPANEFSNTISPLARLLDWLSYKYKLLFIVSAGNHNADFSISGTFNEFKNENLVQRTKRVTSAIKDNIRNYRLLSPAESINALTVGALYQDACSVDENDRQLFAVKDGFPSPISSLGFGHNSQISPDVFYYGGRKFITEDVVRKKCRWVYTNRAPGCKVAAPAGTNMGIAYSFGTSDATAQISHEAGKCYDILNSIFIDETGQPIPDKHAAALIKAMLVHGASWDTISEILSSTINVSSSRLSRWLGNGIPDVSRVEECAKNRATLIGTGMLKPEEAHIFKLPLPFDFTNRILRRLTITLAYFSPVEHMRQKYRATQLWFDVDKEAKRLLPLRQNTDWQRVRRGTLQHEIFAGEDALVWDNRDVEIKINCKADASKRNELTEYGIFVTFEVADNIDVDIYGGIVTKIKQQQPIAIQNT